MHVGLSVLDIQTISSVKSLLCGGSMNFLGRLLRNIITMLVCKLHEISLIILEDMRFHACMCVCVYTSHIDYKLCKICSLCPIDEIFGSPASKYHHYACV